MKVNLPKGKYVVAVSGGVDSIVLLHLLTTIYRLPSTDYEFIVAHFDHGIREDSADDRKLVEATAKKLGLEFVCEEGELGKGASEAQAREARYTFLRKTMKDYKADAIVTAHHQDDAVETLIINLLRGTGRHGILKQTEEIQRPLLATYKKEIVDYAEKHKLKWHEDSTNKDTKYLRNYVRLELLPKLLESDPCAVEKLLDSSVSLDELNNEIDVEICEAIEEKCDVSEGEIVVPRHWLIMLPNEVGREVLYECVRKLDKSADVDRKNIESLLVFAKTAKNNKRTSLTKTLLVRTEPAKIILELV